MPLPATGSRSWATPAACTVTAWSAVDRRQRDVAFGNDLLAVNPALDDQAQPHRPLPAGIVGQQDGRFARLAGRVDQLAHPHGGHFDRGGTGDRLDLDPIDDQLPRQAAAQRNHVEGTRQIQFHHALGEAAVGGKIGELDRRRGSGSPCRRLRSPWRNGHPALRRVSRPRTPRRPAVGRFGEVGRPAPSAVLRQPQAGP